MFTARVCFTASEQESVSLPQSRRVFHCLRAGECFTASEQECFTASEQESVSLPQKESGAGECFTAGKVKCSQQERVHHKRYVVKCTLWESTEANFR